MQETYLRAWRAYDDFEGRSSVRTWLYRIATNVCLTNLENKGRRPLPTGLGMPGRPGARRAGRGHRGALARAGAGRHGRRRQRRPGPGGRQPRLDPARLRGRAPAPAARASARCWSCATCCAGRPRRPPTALETTVAAVNSALQRAHAQLAEKQLTEGTVEDDLTPDHEEMLDRYVQAFWDKDVNALVTMLAKDAIWEMPPFTGWYAGAREHRRADRPPVPRRHARHADDPHLGERPAGVRALHAAARRALRAVPAAGALRSSTAACSTSSPSSRPSCSRPSGCRVSCLRRTRWHPPRHRPEMTTASPPSLGGGARQRRHLDAQLPAAGAYERPVAAHPLRRLGPRPAARRTWRTRWRRSVRRPSSDASG